MQQTPSGLQCDWKELAGEPVPLDSHQTPIVQQDFWGSVKTSSKGWQKRWCHMSMSSICCSKVFELHNGSQGQGLESAWFPTSDTTPDEVSSWESHYMVEEERRWQWEANLKASLHWLEEKVDRLLNPVVNPFSLETPGPYLPHHHPHLQMRYRPQSNGFESKGRTLWFQSPPQSSRALCLYIAFNLDSLALHSLSMCDYDWLSYCFEYHNHKFLENNMRLCQN